MLRHFPKDCLRIELRDQKDCGASGERWRGHHIQPKRVRTIGEDANHILRFNRQMLEQGVGVPRNFIQSVQWYRKAAELGDRGGQSALAWAYFWGRGIVQDDRQAFEWAQRAAEQNQPRAQSLLAVLYGQGRGVARDDSRSAYWYQKAAALGEAGAQNNLGESSML